MLEWHTSARRDLPWRHTRDPWAVLVSEVMLQQTQVARVIERWTEWLQRWPTPADFAAAERTDVIRAWQGLGYNRRAVNLHRAAEFIAEHGWPEDLATLPGVGRYTADAVARFALQQPVLPIDVNIGRVIERTGAAVKVSVVYLEPRRRGDGQDAAGVRLTVRPEPVEGPSRHDGSVQFTHASAEALMDLGATICIARVPRCDECPLAVLCPSRGVTYAPLRKQSRFEGSFRQRRAQTLRALIAGLPDPHNGEPEVMASLVRDGLA